MVWSLEWSGAQVALRPLIAGVASEVHLLAGRPDAACVRLPGGGADRLHVFLRRAVPWWHWAAQPPLLLEPGQLLLARQEDDGLRVRVREGLWLRAGAQGWQRCAVAEGVGVPTRVFGCRAALDLQPWAEKQQIPSPAKLAVGQGRQGTQERMSRERSYPRQARFVHGPTSG